MQDDGRGHAGAAVGDELSGGELGHRLVPGCVQRAGDPARFLVDRIGLTAPARGYTCVDDDQFITAARELVRVDRVVAARAQRELGRLDLFLAARQRPMPRVDVDHRAVVMAEVAQQPPEPFGAAHVPVDDDEAVIADSGTSGRTCEIIGTGQRMPAVPARSGGEIRVDVEKARARDVPSEVELASALGLAQLPAAVDELVAPAYQL